MDEWVSSKAMLEALKKGRGGTYPIDNLMQMLAHGRLRSSGDVRFSGDYRPRAAKDGLQDVPQELWRSKRWKLAEWWAGDFAAVVSQQHEPFYYTVEAFGVRFWKSDAEAMGAVFESEVDGPQTADGPPPARLTDKDLRDKFSRLIDLKLGQTAAVDVVRALLADRDPGDRDSLRALYNEVAQSRGLNPSKPGPKSQKD